MILINLVILANPVILVDLVNLEKSFEKVFSLISWRGIFILSAGAVFESFVPVAPFALKVIVQIGYKFFFADVVAFLVGLEKLGALPVV